MIVTNKGDENVIGFTVIYKMIFLFCYTVQVLLSETTKKKAQHKKKKKKKTGFEMLSYLAPWRRFLFIEDPMCTASATTEMAEDAISFKIADGNDQKKRPCYTVMVPAITPI